MQLAARIAYKHEKRQRVWGGDKTKEMPRVRKDFEVDIALPLGPTYFRRAYRMKKESFYRLYSILKKELQQEFIKSDNGALKKRRLKSVYYIDLKIRLSAAIRFFAGGDPLDIMLTHGISHSSVYTSIWGVVDCVNKCPTLKFNFPTHDEQREISEGFRRMSTL